MGIRGVNRVEERDVKGMAGLRNVVAASMLAAVIFAAQKAKPSRVTFKRGATSAVIAGILEGRQDAEYSLSARSGQTLTLSLDKPGELTPKLFGPDNGELPIAKQASGRWTARLTKDGNQTIVITRTSSNKSSTRYKATFVIR